MKANRLIALLTAITAAGNASATTLAAADTATAASTKTRYGDANLDGKINVADAVAVLQYIVNRAKYALDDQSKLNADVIGPNDGITGTDAIVIQMVDAGLVKPDQLPITQEQYIEITKPKKQDPTEPVTQPTTAPPAETPVQPAKPTAEQLEKMKENPLLVTDSNGNLFIYGDINKSTKLNSSDITNMNKLITNKAEYNPVADLDGDGVVDENDVDLLQDFIDEKITSFPVYAAYDYDEDGLNDFLETAVFNTDRLNADTDGDGLSDLEEIYFTDTDPLVKDSAVKGTSDADVDLDGDGLTNIKEIELGSDPNNKDTDEDGLDDGYEVSKTKTSPVKEDTDGDGLTDFEEQELGLDPLKTATDGTPDNERIITQVIPADDPIFKDVNTEDNAYNLSVEIKAAGYAKHNFAVRESGCAYVLQDGSALGYTPEFLYNEDYKVESITLNFEIKELFRDNAGHLFDGMAGDEYEIDQELDGIKRLNVFKYFESVNLPMPVYTEYDIDNNIVRVTIDTFETDDNGKSYGIGSYSLVDLELWGKMMREAETAPNVENGTAPDSQAPDSKADTAQKSDNSIVKTIPELSKEEQNIVEVNYRTYTERKGKPHEIAIAKGKTRVYQWHGHRYAFYEFKDSEDALEKGEIIECEEKGGHLMVVDSQLEFDLFANGYAKGIGRVYYGFGMPTKNGKYSLPKDWDSETDNISAAFHTGSWIKSKQKHDDKEKYILYGTPEGCEAPIVQGYEEPVTLSTMTFINGIGSIPETDLVSGYICEWEPGDIIRDENAVIVNPGSNYIIEMKEELSPDSILDSDGDGIPDWAEIDHDAIAKLGGKSTDKSLPWKTVQNSINSTLKLAKEKINSIQKKIGLVFDGDVDVVPYTSNRFEEDTDGDGILDCDDLYPTSDFNFEAFERCKVRYEIIDSIDDFQMPDYIERIKETEEEHERKVVGERSIMGCWDPDLSSYVDPEVKSYIMMNTDYPLEYIPTARALAKSTLGIAVIGNIFAKYGWEGIDVSTNEYAHPINDTSSPLTFKRLSQPTVTISQNILKKSDAPLSYICKDLAAPFETNIDLAIALLKYYNENVGGTVFFDGSNVIDKTDGGNGLFDSNIKYMTHIVEHALKPGKSITIKSTPNSSISAWKFSGDKLSAAEENIFLALNACSAVIVADVTYDGSTYTAKIKYYIVDRYDFYEEKREDGHNMVGLVTNDEYVVLSYYDYAEPFDVIGVYEKTATWEKGNDPVYS